MILFGIVIRMKIELFLVCKGTLLVDFRNGQTVKVEQGEMLVIPKGLNIDRVLMVKLYIIY